MAREYPITTPEWDDRLRDEMQAFARFTKVSQARQARWLGISRGRLTRVMRPGSTIPSWFVETLQENVSYFSNIKREYEFVQLAGAGKNHEREKYRQGARDCAAVRLKQLVDMTHHLIQCLNLE